MKLVICGAYGNLGSEILKAACAAGHEVIAADVREREIEGLTGKHTFFKFDATNIDSMNGMFDGVDAVISTVGLTTYSTKVTTYDIDLNGNKNILEAAKKAGVKKFIYTSVISCDQKAAKKVPMLDAKRKFEIELINSGMEYVIHRPTGYFYDIAKVFKPFIEKGEMQLLKGYGKVQANVVSCPDFANFIVEHINDSNAIYSVGGKETYTYEEMAKMSFEACNKPVVIKYVPKFMFSILANLPKIKKEGKHDVMLFGQWTLSHDLVGDTKVGNDSFAAYIKDYFKDVK